MPIPTDADLDAAIATLKAKRDARAVAKTELDNAKTAFDAAEASLDVKQFAFDAADGEYDGAANEVIATLEASKVND